MDKLHEMYEKWKSSQSATHIEQAVDGEHSLERGYIGEFAIDCWAAICAAVEERCVWTWHRDIDAWVASCAYYTARGRFGLSDKKYCYHCGRKIKRKEVT